MTGYWITAGLMIGFQLIILVLMTIGLYRQAIIIGKMTALSPFWRTFQTQVIAKFHEQRDESKEFDRLLCRLETMTLKPEEKQELKSMLRQITDDPKSEERDLAQLLLISMRRVSRERGEPITPVNGIPVSQLN